LVSLLEGLINLRQPQQERAQGGCGRQLTDRSTPARSPKISPLPQFARGAVPQGRSKWRDLTVPDLRDDLVRAVRKVAL